MKDEERIKKNEHEKLKADKNHTKRNLYNIFWYKSEIGLND